MACLLYGLYSAATRKEAFCFAFEVFKTVFRLFEEALTPLIAIVAKSLEF